MTYHFRVQFDFDPETGQVCALIPHLNNLSDYGQNFSEAEQNILKAAELYLQECPEVSTEEVSSGTQISLTLA